MDGKGGPEGTRKPPKTGLSTSHSREAAPRCLLGPPGYWHSTCLPPCPDVLGLHRQSLGHREAGTLCSAESLQAAQKGRRAGLRHWSLYSPGLASAFPGLQALSTNPLPQQSHFQCPASSYPSSLPLIATQATWAVACLLPRGTPSCGTTGSQHLGDQQTFPTPHDYSFLVAWART